MSDFVHLHCHSEYCLSGDTIIYNCTRHHSLDGKCYRNDYTRLKSSKTIKHLYENFRKGKGSTFRYLVKVFDGEKFVPSRIKNISKSSAKIVYELITDSGKSIKSSHKHKFLTKDGWKRLEEISASDSIACNGKPLYEDKDWIEKKYRVEGLKQNEIAKICGVKRKVISTRIVKFGLSKTRSEWCTGREITDRLRNSLKKSWEKRKEKIEKTEPKTDSGYRFRSQKKRIDHCEICGSKIKLHIHHKNKNTRDYSDENLITLCSKCHHKEHRTLPFTIKYEKVISIKEIGIEDTYDIEVEHSAHNFVANGIVTHNSKLDGLGKPQQWADRTADMGMTHLAVTDHGNCDGAIKFQQACKNAGINPIFGAELYIVENAKEHVKGEKRGHITLLVKNDLGWMNLLSLISKSNVDGFYYRPRIQPSWLLENCDGLVIMTACASSFMNFPWGQELFRDLLHFKKDDLYIELMPHQFKEQYETNKLGLEMAEKYGVKTVGTSDAHYIRKSDEISQEVLLAIQTNKKWNDPNRWKFQGSGYYLKSRTEMARAFREQGILTNKEYQEALYNTMEVAEKCNFEIKKLPISLPKVPRLKDKEDVDALKRICEDGLYNLIEKKGKDEKVYRKRYEEELKIILDKGYERYFLIVWDIMSWCKQNDIFTGPGRGSSAGSLICYLMGITRVDPLEFGLVFARFIAPGRKDFPDIDGDYEDTKRHLIRKRLSELYGEYSVVGVSTFSEMKGKGALRDVARVFGIPLADVNKASATIVTVLDGDEGSGHTIEDAFNTFEDGIAFKKKYPQVADIAINLEGNIRNKSSHAAAIVIADEDLRNGTRCAFSLGKEKELLTNWDKEDLEYMGLMKLDVLGLKMLSVFNDTKKRVKKNYNIDIDFDEISLINRRVFREFSKGNNIGCFQVGSPGLRKYCQRLQPENFMELVHAVSLFRPGTLRSGSADSFVKRKHGEENVPVQHPLVEEITKETYGIILYQEQIMQLVYKVAGLDWEVAEKVRKIVAKSKGEEAFKEYEDQFVNGCVKNKTLSEEKAKHLWDELKSMGSYQFNKSHGVVYSLITFWGMWLKVNYPTEYICALLTYGTDKEEDRNEYIEEAFRLGLQIRPPKVGISEAYSWTEKNGILYVPFIDIKGVGEKTAEKFTKLTEKKIKGFYDKEEKGPVTARFMKILEEINAFNDVPLSDEEADRITPMLSVSLVRNRMNKYKKLLNLFKNLPNYREIKDIDQKNPDKTYYLYFGEVTEIKFGYRDNDDGRSGSAYGTIKDSTGYTKISFSDNLWKRKKSEIEHCEGQIMLCLANAPKKAGNILCSDAWFVDEIMSGDLSGLDVQLVESRRFKNTALLECSECELREECTAPVLPSPGRNNVMIIGEAPGKDENRIGQGFVGDSGVTLWKALDYHGYTRRDFHVTNVAKCWPSSTKTPTKIHIKKCRKWLHEEILNIKPKLALAFGNTNVKYFKGEDSGIMQLSGKTEWNEEYGMWIAWCIHPASVLYDPNNKRLFEDAIENFVEKLKIFGLES